METIQQQYDRVRNQIKHGDLILFHGTSLLAKIIQNCDKAFYNHIGVVIEIEGALFIVDSNASGVQADRLSWRIKKYTSKSRFVIIRSVVSDATKLFYLKQLLKRSDDKWIKYDFSNGTKELLNRKFNFDLKIKDNETKDICSDYVSRYAQKIEVVYENFNKIPIAFPQDYMRFRNLDKTILIA